MGCDIHLHIEYNEYDTWWHHSNPSVWRDYSLFGLMAGVRGYEKLFTPRDVPKDVSFQTMCDYTLRITADPNSDLGECSFADAEQWVKHNSSKEWNDMRITHPDFHTPSWLTTAELLQVLERILEPSRSIKAVVAAMKELETARAVFWFDN